VRQTTSHQQITQLRYLLKAPKLGEEMTSHNPADDEQKIIHQKNYIKILVQHNNKDVTHSRTSNIGTQSRNPNYIQL
jgi:hypothetical protein